MTEIDHCERKNIYALLAGASTLTVTPAAGWGSYTMFREAKGSSKEVAMFNKEIANSTNQNTIEYKSEIRNEYATKMAGQAGVSMALLLAAVGIPAGFLWKFRKHRRLSRSSLEQEVDQ